VEQKLAYRIMLGNKCLGLTMLFCNLVHARGCGVDEAAALVDKAGLEAALGVMETSNNGALGKSWSETADPVWPESTCEQERHPL
jgi:hypothetical protein